MAAVTGAGLPWRRDCRRHLCRWQEQARSPGAGHTRIWPSVQSSLGTRLPLGDPRTHSTITQDHRGSPVEPAREHWPSPLLPACLCCPAQCLVCQAPGCRGTKTWVSESNGPEIDSHFSIHEPCDLRSVTSPLRTSVPAPVAWVSAISRGHWKGFKEKVVMAWHRTWHAEGVQILLFLSFCFPPPRISGPRAADQSWHQKGHHSVTLSGGQEWRLT